MGKNILILGGSHGDIPLILAAQKMGFNVITTGNRPNDIGHNYSDEYYKADYSDKSWVLELAVGLNISGICATDDVSAVSASYVADKLGLPGHDSYKTTLLIHHKDKYRHFALKNNIPTPFASKYNSIKSAKKFIKDTEKFKFPLIVKPVDASGGRGISKANNINEYNKAIEKAFSVSGVGRIVVEEFIEGSRHGFSAFLYKGKVKFYFSDNEHYYLNQYRVGAASSPSTVPKSVEEELCRQSEKMAELLSLKDGIFHVQYILKDEKEPIIIEVCRREPGDLYIKFVEYATGVDYPKWIVRESLGLDCGGINHSETKGFFTRYCVKAKKRGRITNISFDNSIKENIIDKFMWWKKGDAVNNIMNDTFGIVFLEFESMEEMILKTNLLDNLIQVSVE